VGIYWILGVRKRARNLMDPRLSVKRQRRGSDATIRRLHLPPGYEGFHLRARYLGGRDQFSVR